jgi:excisionase family DNA binding protein
VAKHDDAVPTVPLAYTITGFCEATGLSRATVYRLFQAGVITPRKAGARTLIMKADAEAYLQSLPEAEISKAS